MRTLAGITAVLMASMTLWSCDQQPTQTAQAPAAPPPPCNCQPVPPPVAQVPPPVPVQTASVSTHRRHHRHHYYASEQIMPGSAGYVSDSGAMSESDDESAQYSSSSSVSYVGPPPMAQPSFVDGYGRAHFWSQNTVSHFAHQADDNAYFTRKRLKPWRKYGATCDWR